MREPATHAHPRSPASSNRSAAYAPAMASPRERPSTAKPAATSSNAGGGLGQWQALRGAPQADTAAPANVASAFQENAKQSTSATAGNSGIQAQYAPPAINATAPMPTVKPVSPTIKKENVAPPTAATSNGVNGTANPATSFLATPTPHQVGATSKKMDAKAGEASSFTSRAIPKSSIEGTMAEDKATNAAASAAKIPVAEVKKEPVDGQNSSGDSAFDELRNEIAALNKRIVALEAENFTLQKQVETLLQSNERRKFLGTDSASIPFALEVKDGELKTFYVVPKANPANTLTAAGASLTVQVAADLKVGDLIRRIRTKADIAPVNSKDPRITFNGQQLGHGMMLGEAGVTQGCAVVFTYGEQ